MARVVALLRGVNIGKRQLPMAELRSGLEAAGCTDVATYVQSGNVVLTPPHGVGRDVAGWLSATIGAVAGFEVPVVVRTKRRLAALAAADPFPAASGTQRHVVFCGATPPTGITTRLGDEEATLVGGDVVLHLPHGMGRAKLPTVIERELVRAGVVGTSRNWNTVVRLLDMA